MKSIFSFAAVSAILIAGLASCTSSIKSPVRGIVVDGTMNTLMIVAMDSGDTLSFSTMDAEKVCSDGIIIGDTAICHFEGGYKKDITPATKVEVIPDHLRIIPIGSWTEPVPGLPDMKQGITISEGGVAASINMATLPFSTWSYEKKTVQRDGYTEDVPYLTLTGQSIGNGQTIDITNSYQILRFDADSLILVGQAGDVHKYGREK